MLYKFGGGSIRVDQMTKKGFLREGGFEESEDSDKREHDSTLGRIGKL